MNVLIVVPGFPVNTGQIKGGVHSALANLLKGFAELPVNIRVVSFNRELAEKKLTLFSSRIEIYYHPEGRFPHAINYLFNGSKIVRQHIRQFNPSIVHYSMGGYILLTRVWGLYHRVTLTTIHGIAFPEARQKKKLKDKLVFYSNGIVEIFCLPKNLIHLSNYSRTLMGRKGNYSLIPNAVDSSFFAIAPKDKTHNKLIYAGAIDRNKNLIFLLKALKQLVDQRYFFKLDVLGGYTETDGYEQEINTFIEQHQLGAYVQFHGWVNQSTLQTILAKADILVVSSFQESLPMVIAEAMAAGKLVIASRVGGIPEMIEHGEDGFIMDTDKPENLAQLLIPLYQQPGRVLAIQKKARQKALATYPGKRIAEKTLSFYQQLLLGH